MEVMIKAVMPGTETIAVYNEFFQEIGTCEITVEPGTLRFPERKITLIEGDTYTLTMPDDASASLSLRRDCVSIRHPWIL